MSCECWQKRDDEVRKKYGVKIANACSALEIDTSKGNLDMKGVYGLPLQRIDGRKVGKDQPALMVISYCPFCGQKYEEKKDEPKSEPKPAGS